MATARVMRALLVDDDTELSALLLGFFSAYPVDLTVCHNGRDGLHLALDGDFDIVLLDVMLPVIDGFEILRQLRRRSQVPVVMLTARTDHDDRMAGFRAGADDYLPKPFHPEELYARCQALLRRAQGTNAQAAPSAQEIGGVRVDASVRQAFTGNESLELTGMEFDLLDILVRSAGRIVTRDEIWAAIHQREPSPFERALDTHMSNLRKKLAGRSTITIRTIRSTGYLLAAAE